MNDTAAPIDPVRLAAHADATWLNRAQRQRDLDAASTSVADILVVGAGVTGAGAALDAASRGLSVVIVEAGDIAIGTSSRSGKIFHGGLRYLEQLDFRLVADAVRERDAMLGVVCPHLARPAPFLYPLTHAGWERAYVGAGVLLYDLFGRKTGAVPRQRHFGRAELKRHVPSIDSRRVLGGIQYHDAVMDDARHTLAVVRSAASRGARVVTQAPLIDFLKDGDRIIGAVVRDSVTGLTHALRARAVISATGVWAEEVQRLAGADTVRVQPAKGVHLLLRSEALQSDTGILARATDSVIIARRWYGNWLVGTTDSPWHGDASRPVAVPADIDDLLGNLNAYLARKVSRADVLGVFAGLRPLVKPLADARTTSALLRDHAVIEGPPGLTTIVGGKYTTYRRMAADAVDAAVRPLGITRPSCTAALPLVGSVAWQAVRDRAGELADRFGLSHIDAGHLLQRHGDRVRDLLALAAEAPGLGRPVPGASQYALVELVYAVVAEAAQSLADVLVRRTHLSIEQVDGALAIAPMVAETVAPYLGWSGEDIRRQLLAYRDQVAAERAALLQDAPGIPLTGSAPDGGRP